MPPLAGTISCLFFHDLRQVPLGYDIPHGGNIHKRDFRRVRGGDILAMKTRDTADKPPRHNARLRTSMPHLATTSAGGREVGEAIGMSTKEESASTKTKTDEYGSDAGKL
jgi:hypothetical protein